MGGLGRVPKSCAALEGQLIKMYSSFARGLFSFFLIVWGFFALPPSDPIPVLPFLPIFGHFGVFLRSFVLFAVHVYFALRGCFSDFILFLGFGGTLAIFLADFGPILAIFGNFISIF